jgi:rfaE bifunctional protein kinase chain/domain
MSHNGHRGRSGNSIVSSRSGLSEAVPHEPPLGAERLRDLLSRFTGRRILVVGDCMLDEYLWGRVNRISPEAPVMVVEQQEATAAAGGASNVATNLVALGASAQIVAVVGADPMADRLREELSARGISHEGLVTDPSRGTTVKTRVIAHNQQVLRIDREDRRPVAPEIEALLIERARLALDQSDAVLFSDYSKGTLTEAVVAAVADAARQRRRPLFVNPKPGSFRYYQRPDLLTLNQVEAETITGGSLAEGCPVDAVGSYLLATSGAAAVIVTLGGRGLALFEAGKPGRRLPVIPLEVFDPCGCGDSAIAAAALARASGAEWTEAAMLANLAGNAKVRKLGVVPVTPAELEAVARLSLADYDGVGLRL